MLQKIQLPNGLPIIVEQIPTYRSVSIGIWVGTGSRFEEEHENGISHFLEHMFFKGTETRSAQEIAEAFDAIGGQVNAFTSKEYTCYYAKVLDEHATYAIDLLADMFFHSTFEESELEKEKNVVYEEIKMVDDTPDDIIHDMLSRASFGNHSLGQPILGTVEALKTFNGDMLRNYMERFYKADNVVISVAGNVSEELIEKIIAHFSRLERSHMEKKLIQPPFLTERIIRQKDTEQAHLCIGFQGLKIGHEDHYSLIVLNNILGGSMSSRLFQEIRENRGLAYSVFSYHSAYKDTGMVTIYAGTAPEQLDELYDAIMITLERLREKGITEKELRNSKEQLKGSFMLSLESTNNRMSRNGKNELLLKRHFTLDEILQEINRVSMEKVNQMIKEIFTDQFSLSLISPTGKFPKGVKY